MSVRGNVVKGGKFRAGVEGLTFSLQSTDKRVHVNADVTVLDGFFFQRVSLMTHANTEPLNTTRTGGKLYALRFVPF